MGHCKKLLRNRGDLAEGKKRAVKNNMGKVTGYFSVVESP